MGVNLNSDFGRVEVAYLTGQGRAPGDLYFEITRQVIQNGDNVDVQIRDSVAPLRLRLDGFQTLSARINVPFTATSTGIANNRNFSQLLFDPNRLLVEGSNGTLTNTGVDLSASNLPVVLDARIRAFPGRNSVVQLRVSSATASLQDTDDDPNTPDVLVFDEALFKSLNYAEQGTDPDGEGRVASRLSDFVRFSLANVPVADRPDLRQSVDEGDVIANGAQYVYFSGDNVALSNSAPGQGSIFQEVGNVFSEVVIGKWADVASGGFLGTYDLRDANPEDPENTPTSLVSIYGQFRDYNTVLTGGGSFEIVMFPNSGETYSFEGNNEGGVRGRGGDIVAFVRNANNQIVNMYFGQVDFGDRTFELFPIRGLGADPADPDIAAARLTGTVTGDLRGIGGDNVGNDYPRVRSFSYAFDGAVPNGFLASGNATVFRK